MADDAVGQCAGSLANPCAGMGYGGCGHAMLGQQRQTGKARVIFADPRVVEHHQPGHGNQRVAGGTQTTV